MQETTFDIQRSCNIER